MTHFTRSATQHGWKIEHTGANGTALTKRLPSRARVAIVTTQRASMPERESEPSVMTIYPASHWYGGEGSDVPLATLRGPAGALVALLAQ